MDNNLQNLPTEELLKKEKSLKFVTGLLMGFAIVLYAVAIFYTIKGGVGVAPLIICGLALSALLPMRYKEIKSIREEINRR